MYVKYVHLIAWWRKNMDMEKKKTGGIPHGPMDWLFKGEPSDVPLCVSRGVKRRVCQTEHGSNLAS